MAKLIYFFICLTIVFGTGYSLKCYKCDSEKLDGCVKNEKPTEQPCGNAPPNMAQFCFYKTAYDSVKKVNFANSSCIQVPAGSALDRSSIPDCKTPPAGIEIKECRVCALDLCNSAPLTSTSLITMMCLPLIFVFAKIFSH
uniref:Protein sleepless n=1 Tax=Lygus hesperus TaxID=30085 RepID=A0A146L3Y6_LYGHE